MDELNLSISANEKPEARNAVILIGDKNASLIDTLYIHQAQKDIFYLVQKEFNIKSEGEAITIELVHNMQSYSSYISSKDKEWLNIQQTEANKTLTNNKMQVVVAPNENVDSRLGKIIFYSEDYKLSDTLIIHQAAQSKLILDETTFIVQGQGGNISVKVQSNIEYEVCIAENASSWISQIQTKALTEDVLNFYITPNTTSATRTGEIEIKDKNSNLADTIYITQANSDTYYGDVNLKTIDEAKTFAEMKCKKIEGNLIISGNQLVTLSYLNNQLEEIRDSLIINCTSLTNLDGLYGLKSIGGNVTIKTMSSNPNLEGLNNLESIGGNLIIYTGNSLKGLCNLQSIGKSLKIYGGTFSSFSGLEKLTTIPEDFELRANDNLISFQGLNNLQNIDGNFNIITQNSLNSLVSFEGLENLSTIGGNFEIDANAAPYNPMIEENAMAALESFKGLGQLSLINGNFKIRIDNARSGYFGTALGSLASFEGLENLKNIGGDFDITSDNNLASFNGLENLTNIGGDFILSINGKNMRNFNGLNKLSNIGGSLEIREDFVSGFASFEGLENLENIQGDFYIDPFNDGFAIENHLSNLKSIGGNATLYTNPTTNTNLNKLEYIGGELFLDGDNLFSIRKEGVVSLPILQEIGGKCFIENLDMIDFPSIEFIGGALSIGMVNSIGNLDKLKSVGDITIEDCENLYDFCNWKPVLTDYNGTFLVTGCGYNPTKYQILNGECSQTPEN